LDRAVAGEYPDRAAGVPVVYPDHDDVAGECGVVSCVVVDQEGIVIQIYFDHIGHTLTL
jgi:hypothetical protein